MWYKLQHTTYKQICTKYFIRLTYLILSVNDIALIKMIKYNVVPSLYMQVFLYLKSVEDSLYTTKFFKSPHQFFHEACLTSHYKVSFSLKCSNILEGKKESTFRFCRLKI